MFIFIKNQELWTRELMSHIMDCDHSMNLNDILKFIYRFMIIFLTVYIFKYFSLLVSYVVTRCNNIVTLSLNIFYLNWNQHMNLYKYKTF
jgi:hypothetical protein